MMMQTIFGLDLLEKLKVKAIDPDQIHLTPNLVKKVTNRFPDKRHDFSQLQNRKLV